MYITCSLWMLLLCLVKFAVLNHNHNLMLLFSVVGLHRVPEPVDRRLRRYHCASDARAGAR